MTNTYITPIEYKRATTGQESDTLVGNLTRVGTALTAGATTLNVYQPTVVALSQYDQIAIFDGSNSEVVTVGSAGAIIGATNIPISAAQYSHASGTVVCSDGMFGSLSEAIIIASSTVESICLQPLLAATYTESLPLRTMAANINNEGAISIRPRHFPVTAVSAMSIEPTVGSTFGIDQTQAIIETRAMLINVPVVNALPGSPIQVFPGSLLDQTTTGFINLTYTAGYTYASLPWDIKQACILLTSDALGNRLNPSGAANIRTGQVQRETYVRGDLSGQTSLYKRAQDLLKLYTKTGW